MLIEEIRSDGPSPEIRAYRYNLTSGARQDLAKVKGLPRITEPEIGSYDGTYAYSTTDSQRRSCLLIGDMNHVDARHLFEHLAGQVNGAAGAGGSEIQLARILFGVSDEFDNQAVDKVVVK